MTVADAIHKIGDMILISAIVKGFLIYIAANLLYGFFSFVWFMAFEYEDEGEDSEPA